MAEISISSDEEEKRDSGLSKLMVAQLLEMGYTEIRIRQAAASLQGGPITVEAILQVLIGPDHSAKPSIMSDDVETVEGDDIGAPVPNKIARTRLPVADSNTSPERPLLSPAPEDAVEAQLQNMGFDVNIVRTASQNMAKGISPEEACQNLFSQQAKSEAGDPGQPTVGAASASIAGVRPALLRRMSRGSLQVLTSVASKAHAGISHVAVARLLLRAAAALQQGLLTASERHQLHRHLEDGDVDLVHAIVASVGARDDPALLVEESEKPWECEVCFASQTQQGWSCPTGHRYCCDCMRRHAESIPFPRCPTESCGYAFTEQDMEQLAVEEGRLEAFRKARLWDAVATLGNDSQQGATSTAPRSSSDVAHQQTRRVSAKEEVVRCPNSSCQNAVLVPRHGRLRYECACGTPAFCTSCRQSPYHYHAECSEIQGHRERWLSWISGDRERYFGQAKASQAFEQQVAALREGMDRQQQLETDEQWKQKHCRMCPKCRRPIQKLEGCASMVCGADYHGGNEQQGCGERFSWSKALPYEAQAASRQLPEITANDIRCRGHNTLHFFVNCALCGSGGQGIKGPRFRCLHCASFDVCKDCEPKLGELHEHGHVFQVMFESDFSWASVGLPKGSHVRLVRSGDIMPPNLEDISANVQLEGLCGIVIQIPEGRKRRRDANDGPKVYEWQSDRGRWHAYGADASVLIQNAVQNGLHVAKVMSDGKEYQIDLRRMCQRNLRTGGLRKVRAVPDPKAAVAAAMIGNASSSSASQDPYRIRLDNGSGAVVVPVCHLEPVLDSRDEAEALLEKALVEQEDGVPSPSGEPVVDEDEEGEEEDGDDDMEEEADEEGEEEEDDDW